MGFLRNLFRKHVLSPEQRLMRAADSGDLATARDVLDRHPEAVNANQQHVYHATPLMWAASSGRTEICKLLLDRGADILARDDVGRDAFFYLADGMIRGSGTLNPDPGVVFDPTDHVETGRLLLARGANAKTVSDDGQTPLSRTIWGFNHVTSFLIDCGADIEARDRGGSTLLMRAAAGKSERVVKVLLDRGADVLATNAAGQNALEIAEGSSDFADRPQHAVTLLLLRAAVAQRRDADARALADAPPPSIETAAHINVKPPLKLAPRQQ